MEDPRVAQTVAPQPPPPPPPTTKKRPLEISHLEKHPYYKMRALLRDVRPQFIEVLRTPDFRNCQAASEIRDKLKVLMDLYKELTASSTGGIQDGHNPKAHEREAKHKPNPSDKKFNKPAEDELSGQQTDGRVQGTYVVGGSAFGWNFITFPGNSVIYCGRTKETYRSSNPKSQESEDKSSELP